jgi:hypothetical protein
VFLLVRGQSVESLPAAALPFGGLFAPIFDLVSRRVVGKKIWESEAPSRFTPQAGVYETFCLLRGAKQCDDLVGDVTFGQVGATVRATAHVQSHGVVSGSYHFGV